MKNKLFILVLAVLLAYSSYGQQLQTIPDANFRNYLLSKYPECFSGQLLDTSCNGIKYIHQLDVSNLGISDLTGAQFLKGLVFLNCSNNNLTTLDGVLPDSIVRLDCMNNRLVALPRLPDSLQVLDCSLNSITTLPVLPSKIDILNCSSNKLTSLPSIPGYCTWIIADSNQITSVPVLPASLNLLKLNHNELTSFPAIPADAVGLTTISVGFNKITSVPDLPTSLKNLDIRHNQISQLPSLPSGLLSLFCSNNNITCFPMLPWGLRYLGFKSNPITCIPNMPKNLTTFNGTTTIICNAENTKTSNCDYLVPVQGTVFMDYNGNQIQDEDEKGVANILVKASSLSAPKTLTNYLGQFTLYLSPGTYLYTVDVPDTLFKKNPGNRLIKITEGMSDAAQYNFALQPVKEIRKLKVDITSETPPRPGFQTSYTITCMNTGNYPITAPDLSFSYSSLLSYESSTVAILNHQDTTLKWSLPELYPGQRRSITVTFTLSASATLGTKLSSNAILKPVNATDSTLNYYSLDQNVVGSYDPNDKTVFPEGAVLPSFVEERKPLEYTIRFQNTGTAEAINVVVTDTLSNLIDEETLTMVSSSHEYRYEQRNNIITWTFENINLPDMNNNEPESHGFVKFMIKPKIGVDVGDVISNSAGIIFDFNEPIITNKAETPVILLTGVIEREDTKFISLYPNPSSGKVNLKLNSIEKPGNAVISVRNNLNQEVIRKTLFMTGTDVAEFDILNLSSGMYFVELYYNGTLYRECLMKW